MKQADTLFDSHTSNDAVKVIQLDSFVPAFVEPRLTNAELQRRFSTFLLASKAKRGAFRAALNTSEEQIALKSPLFISSNDASGKETTETDKQCIEKTQKLMLLEEYRNSQAVSNIKGFPKVYGLGYINDCPVIVSEYIEGVTLAKAIDHNLPRNESSIDPYVAATIVQTATAILLNARCLDGSFIHRDLSPRNIIIKTDKRTLKEQLAQGVFDLRLVDMGSATYRVPESPFRTVKQGIWRFGTAEYAAPEMLTRDIEGIAAKRYSETIDTYALCSILYLMLAGKAPFQLAMRISESPYLIKTKEEPAHVTLPKASETLLQLATKGITAKQKNRYLVDELYSALESWRKSYAKTNGIKSCPPPEQFCLAR